MEETSEVDLIHEISRRRKSQRVRTRKRKPQSAAVLTSTPYKQQLVMGKLAP